MDAEVIFSCNGKVNPNDWQLGKTCLFSRGELENVLYPQEHDFSNADVRVFDSVVPAESAMCDLKHFVYCMDMQLKVLTRHEKYSHLPSNDDAIDCFAIRRSICEFLLYVRTYMNSIKWDLYSMRAVNFEIEEHLDTLIVIIKKFLSRLRSIPDATFHYAVSNLGNKCTQPEFHMYHMHIELRWFLVTLTYMHSICWQYSVDTQENEFESICTLVINDLIYISLKMFERILISDLRQKTPYNCTCLRELWLMLQILLDNTADRMKSKSFWDYVNSCINTILSKNSSENIDTYWYGCVSGRLPDCKNPELFCIWIIYNLSLLYGYNDDGIYLDSMCSRIRSNHEQIEKILKTYICKGGKDGERDEIDEELRAMIPLLHILITDWWQPRVSIISFLWDCFHKRLDQPFLVQTSGPWTVSIEKKTAADIYKQVKERIDGNFDYVKESSYGMFLRFLGNFLKKNYTPTDTKHWNQIKGRIYSKFSKSKVQEFSEAGHYNFLSLFLTLAITADTANVCSVMFDLLPPTHEITNENNKKCSLIWKGKLAVLLLFNELRFNFSTVAASFTDTINVASCRKDETCRSMMTNFVDVLDTILSSTTKMELGEHLFIGGWIDRYLLECPKTKIGSLIRSLLSIFEKCASLKTSKNETDGVGKMLDALWRHVACRVRQFVFDPVLTGDHYRDLAKLAVAFTLEALRDPTTVKKHKHSAVSLFQHFAASVIIRDTRITRCYLNSILEKEETIQDLKKEIKNFDLILIQAWIKCSILGHDTSSDEGNVLKTYVSQLEEIKQTFLTHQEFCEFQNNEESVLIFVMSVMKKRNSLIREQDRVQFDARCRLYFNNLEKWILLPITDENKQSEFAFWIYKCVGTLILCCSPLLYTKNQPNNMLRTLINKVALPSENSPQYIKTLGKRIFSMILLGIENLNVKGDISLQVLIRDLFDQYVPLLITETDGTNFKISDALLKCFKDAQAEFLRLIFEMLMVNFYTVFDNIMHKHSYLVTLLLKSLLRGGKIYAQYVIDLIVSICTSHVIGCYMKVHDHHPHKRHTIEFISDIIGNPYYKEDNSLRKKLGNAISSSVQKYLTVYPQFTFEFMRSLSHVKIDLTKDLFPLVERTVSDLERNRRPNAASLRYSLNQLKTFIKSIDKS